MVYLKTDASTPTEPTPPASPLTPVLPSSVEFDIDTEIFDVTITFVNSVTSFYVQMIGSGYSVSCMLDFLWVALQVNLLSMYAVKVVDFGL